MPRPFLALAVLASPLAAQAADYVVACASGAEGYLAAAEELRAHHRAALVRFDPADLGGLRDALKRHGPRHVAYVVEPAQLDFDLCRRLLQMATELDDDPFVDFAYGFFTGADAAETQAFVRRSVRFEGGQQELRYARVAGGVDQSRVMPAKYRLRTRWFDTPYLMVAGKKSFPEVGRDRAFVREHLPELAGRNLLMFIGHGYPREVSGGPDYRDLRGLDFSGAVVVNVPCYTGVTHRYFERDYRSGVVHQKTIPLAESFALALLRTGVVGYTAYTCPRPAGPELDCDLQELVAHGHSLGTARRRDYDKTVLGFLGYGQRRLELARFRDGGELPPVQDAVRDMMLEGATGGILFGDPALRPFAAMPGEELVRVAVTPRDGGVRVRIDCPAHAVPLVCSDPTARRGRTMALRAYARVPLSGRLIRGAALVEVELSRRAVDDAELLWAFERDRGETFAQVKVVLPRPEQGSGSLVAELDIETTADPAQAVAMGIPERRAPVAPAPRSRPTRSGLPDVAKREITPAMAARQARWKVGDAALAEAVELTFLALTFREKPRLAALRARGEEGFRALCLLLEVGHQHYRTKELFAATLDPSHLGHLMALARRRPLPNYSDWTLLEILGRSKSETARDYLLEQLRGAPDAGIFAHAALGLARQGTADAVPAIVERLEANRASDRGVHHLLISALQRLGGADARDGLRRYAALEGAPQAEAARSAAARLR